MWARLGLQMGVVQETLTCCKASRARESGQWTCLGRLVLALVFAQCGEVVRQRGRLAGVVGAGVVGYVLALVVDGWLSGHEAALLVMVLRQAWRVAMGQGLVGHLWVLTLRQMWSWAWQ